MRVGCDLDGTLIPYSHNRGDLSVNRKLIDQLLSPGDEVIIITNQGGIPFWCAGVRREVMPSPDDFVQKAVAAAVALKERGVNVLRVYASVYHPNVSTQAVEDAVRGVQAAAARQDTVKISVFWGQDTRKPHGKMLKVGRVEVFIGDSDEDYAAAKDAGVTFIRVDRYGGDR